MKILALRARLLLILSGLFIIGLLVFGYRYLADGQSWALYPVNGHIYRDGQFIFGGTIYDANGQILAQTVDEQRLYHQDATMRSALMPLIGDPNGNIATGLEAVYRGHLSGYNHFSGLYNYQEPGRDLHLTIDADLTALAYQKLADYKGTAAIIDYQSGQVLALASSPSFDPLNPPDISEDDSKYEGVYLNRFFTASYTPGSIFKLITLEAALELIPALDERNFSCSGSYALADGGLIHCPYAHGDIDIKQALAQSCNMVFGQLALELGQDTLADYAQKAGFNQALQVGDIPLQSGYFDNQSPLSDYDLAWTGIGQGQLLANPAAFLQYVAAIANDGLAMPLQIVKPGIGANLFSQSPNSRQMIDSQTAAILQDFMLNNVSANYGAGDLAAYNLAAKSGTAEVGADNRPHSWFIGFLDNSDYPLAFVVIVENGGSGNGLAADIAHDLLAAWIKP